MTLKRYDAVVNGTKTILLLNAEDAAALGDTVTLRTARSDQPSNKAAKPGANQSRTPQNKKIESAPGAHPAQADQPEVEADTDAAADAPAATE